MKSSAVIQSPASQAVPGRPIEVEDTTNLYLVHPVSRALVDRLVNTPVTPNQVSVASVFLGAAGAYCYWAVAWPWGPLAALAFLFAWHVFDGADGDLARRTGRASVSGELVDGVCDHISQALVYVAFAAILQRSLGGWAWGIAALASVCHFVQANIYETGRKSYRHWVYGAAWMRQGFSGANALQRLLSGLYMGVSRLASPGEGRIEAAMNRTGGGAPTASARVAYREVFVPLVKTSGVLGGNARTLAGFFSLLAGSPLWFFLFEIVVLDLALIALTLLRVRRNKDLLARLAPTDQAAFAPN